MKITRSNRIEDRKIIEMILSAVENVDFSKSEKKDYAELLRVKFLEHISICMEDYDDGDMSGIQEVSLEIFDEKFETIEDAINYATGKDIEMPEYIMRLRYFAAK